MASRGIFQLKNITFLFCDWGGSSKGAREFLESDLLKEFIYKNPQISFDFFMKRGTHPFIQAHYINGYRKDCSLRNTESEEILEIFKKFRNSMGKRPIPHEGKKVHGITKSVQGGWKHNMWGAYPKHELEKVPKLPIVDDELEYNESKVTRMWGKHNHKDFVNHLMKDKNALADL